MADGITLALVGATTMAGESTLAVLESSALKPSELFLVDSDEGAGEHIRHRGKEYLVQPVAEFDFSQADVTIFAAGTEVSAAFARKAAAEGSFVVDASDHFLSDEKVPLVLPGINPQALESADSEGLVTLPHAATSQLATVLKPLHDAVGIRRVDVTAMLAVSEKGKAGVDELSSQAVSLFNMREVKSEVFPQQVVFNAVPQVGAIDSSGASMMEQAVAAECRSLLGDNSLPVSVSALWLPVFFGHSLTVHLQLSDELSALEAEQLLAKNPLIELGDSPSAVESAANSEAVFVGRLCQESNDLTALRLWIVADNVRFGIARNVISIAEILEKSLI
jgi:aspartate-semialdehyde dehydrogenase